MNKRVIIVHGWGGYPEEGWFPWLKNELEKRNFEVIIPRLPHPDNPKIDEWISVLAKAADKVDENTYFVGHSMGCQAIVRLLEILPNEVKVGGAVFVGAWFKKLTGLDDPEDQDMGEYWLSTPIDFSKVRDHLAKSIAIFSDDDPYVPLDNQDDLKNKLGSEIILQHQMGHFSGSTGTTQLPVALKALLEISNG